MNADFYIQVLIFICVLIGGCMAMWVCRMLRMENYFSRKELQVFFCITLTYVLVTACIFIRLMFKS